MSKSNLNMELVNLFKEIKKIENHIEESENNKNTCMEKYKKINKIIKEFIEKKNKDEKSEKSNLTRDIIDGLKIINIAYKNNSKNDEFNSFVLTKEKMINKYLAKYHQEKKQKEIKQSTDENEDQEFLKDFEIITDSELNGIIDECLIIQKMLNENKITEEKNKINELEENISHIIIEANQLMNNNKLIDDEAIKRLNYEINAIKKESNKLYKKYNNLEKYKKIYECK